MTGTPCPPHRCHHPLRIGSVVVHACDGRFMEPIEPAPSLRIVKAAS